MSLPLWLVGWEPFTPEMLEMVDKYPKLIMVYPHNSMFDFWISMFLLRAHPLLRRRTRTIVNRRFMDFPFVGGFLRQWNCISGSGNVRGQQTLGKLVKELQEMGEFIVPIAPKGDIKARRWRSGYYQLAKQTGAHLLVGCFDYHRHKFTLGTPFEIGDMTLEEVELKCKREMVLVPATNLHNLEFPHPQQQVPLAVSCVSSETHIRNFLLLSLLILMVAFLLLVIRWYRGKIRLGT